MRYDTNQIKQMYNSVDDAHLRTWKVFDTDGVCRQNKFKIYSTEHLKKFLGKNPDKVYVSIGKFHNPHKVFGKKPKRAQWMYVDSLFYNSELFFDFDSESDLKLAIEDGRDVIKFMEGNPRYKLKDIIFSGSKGFHLVYKDLKPNMNPDPLKRLKATEQARKRLIDKLPKLNTVDKLHKKIFCDQFRVRAVPYSFKTYMVSFIDKDYFMNQPYSKIILLVRSKQPMTRTTSATAKSHRPNIPDDMRPGISINPRESDEGKLYPLSFKFITNRVEGTKTKYVPVLKYHKKTDTDHIIRLLQKRYKLGSFYLLQSEDIKTYICLTVVDKSRLIKIMRMSKCINMNSFTFYGYTWIPITPTLDSKGKIVYPLHTCKKVIQIPTKKENISKPHARLFNIIGYIGNTHNKVRQAIIKSREEVCSDV
jgi:hypothetical protein